MFRQTDHPDDSIEFDGRTVYPVATLELVPDHGTPARNQIIPDAGELIAVSSMDGGKYNRVVEPFVPEVAASLEWACAFLLGVGGVPDDVPNEEHA